MSSLDRDHERGSQLPQDVAEIEAGLRSFEVTAGRLDRERLMFELGCESARQAIAGSTHERSIVPPPNARTVWPARSHFWPVATAALLLLSTGLVVALQTRPERIVLVERVVAANELTSRQTSSLIEQRRPAEQRGVAETPVWRGGQYFTQRQIAVMHSVEALPARPIRQSNAETSQYGQSPPLTARELWKTWSEENQTPQPTPASEPDWLRWLNPETWL